MRSVLDHGDGNGPDPDAHHHEQDEFGVKYLLDLREAESHRTQQAATDLVEKHKESVRALREGRRGPCGPRGRLWALHYLDYMLLSYEMWHLIAFLRRLDRQRDPRRRWRQRRQQQQPRRRRRRRDGGLALIAHDDREGLLRLDGLAERLAARAAERVMLAPGWLGGEGEARRKAGWVEPGR